MNVFPVALTYHTNAAFFCYSLLSLFSFRSDFVKSREVYERLGQYSYQKPDYTDDIIELNGPSSDVNKYVYIGQVKANSKTRDGIGI